MKSAAASAVSTLAMRGGTPAVRDAIKPYNPIGEDEKRAVIEFMDKGLPLSGFHGSARPSFFGGPEVQAFEEEWKAFFGSRHAVSVNSATSGLMVAMGAIGIEPGDEVIVPPYTMTATAMAPIIYGGVPVFVDVEDDYFCLDVAKVRAAITPKTKAIIAVNLFGHPAQLSELRALADERGLYLVEDNAQAVLGREWDQWTAHVGHIGVYSLNVHKHIQCGEGSICVTADDDLALRMKLIRNHGENVIDWLKVDNLTNLIGYNFRMSEIHAAIARAQLKKVEPQVQRCERMAQALTEGVRGLPGLTPPKVRAGCRHNYFQWTMRYDESLIGVPREKFVAALQAEGVPVAQGYVPPIYWLPMFQKKIAMGGKGFPFSSSGVSYTKGMCPVTERLHVKEVIQFQPVSWVLSDAQTAQVIDAFRKVHAHAKDL